jgi:hypothetical protein
VKYIFVIAILIGVVGAAAPLNAGEPIAVSVYPAVAVARGEAQLRIVVERNQDNRVLAWEVDGPSYYRSSTAQLDGADAPRSWLFFVKNLSAGSYQVRAVVKRSNNSESVAATQMMVMGR